MWDFIRKIFSEREGDVTVVVLDDENPDGSNTFKFAATDFVKITSFVVIVSVLLTTIIFFATPLGSLYQHQQDDTLREEAILISERLVGLRDSLEARDQQLADMKNVLQAVPDTTFDIQYTEQYQSAEVSEYTGRDPEILNAFDMLSQNEIIFSENFEQAPEFPASYPVRGSRSQGFEPDKGHYGMDIASRSNSEFTALADGVVLYTDWTINYGYVLYLQHNNGIISVYKHASRVLKQQGDFVLKGDILGSVSDTGVLSSGSHLHLEIWKNGIPQNPDMYLIN